MTSCIAVDWIFCSVSSPLFLVSAWVLTISDSFFRNHFDAHDHVIAIHFELVVHPTLNALTDKMFIACTLLLHA